MTSLYPKLFQDHLTRYISVDHGKIKIPDNIFHPDLRWLTKTRGAWGIFNILSTCVTREHDPRPRLRLCYRPSESQVECRLRDLLFAERFVIYASPSSGALCAFRIEISGRLVEPRYSLHRNGVSLRMMIFETPSPVEREADIRISDKYFYLSHDMRQSDHSKIFRLMILRCEN